MKIKYKEDTRAWRKSTLFTVFGLLLLSSVLQWRHVLSRGIWAIGVVILVCLGLLACARPAWFRQYYRFSTWAGFWSSQAVAWLFLAVIFVIIITPAALVMHLLGKDPLRLKRSEGAKTYWIPVKRNGSLDRLF
jgi:hypothetical protein